MRPGDGTALALSGGGDSIALMHLLGCWARDNDVAPPRALIVDHGLRRSSGAEAARVALWARAAGFPPEILRWKGAKPDSNIEEQAREARYALLGDACKRNGLSFLFVAHTRDDLAETFLLRLARGSGVDGLSAMPAHGTIPVSGYESVALLRPLLDFSRDDLRTYARQRGAEWIEDPMNEDPRFARTRMRRLLPVLEQEGLPVRRIAQAAQHLARAREALESETAALLKIHSASGADGSVQFDAGVLRLAPREIGLRLLAAVLMQVSGRRHRPRFDRLERLFSDLSAEPLPAARTLHGCRIGRARKQARPFGAETLTIRREAARHPVTASPKAQERAHSRARM